MDNSKNITMVEWCAGYGGIHLGLKRAIPNLRVIAYGEIEAFACANLVAKMEAGLLDAAPIWTDIKTFPCEEFRDRVDILTGGYPCQPFSAAGKRLGTEDPRHLWPFIADGIRLLRPKLCFFENVEGHISLGLREVIGELESIGYTAAWGIFSASEVGAPHQRKRVFILAVSNSLGGAAGLSRSLAWNEGIAGVSDNGGGEGDGELADANGRRFEQCESKPKQSDNAGLTSKQAWPSRPGEQQFAWEPPRVVAHDHRPHAGHGEQRPERTLGDLSGGCGEAGAMGNAEYGREDGASAQVGSEKSSKDERESETARAAQTAWGGRVGAMGNAEQFLLPATREHGAMDEASGIPADRKGSESSQADPESSAARKREGHGADASERSQTQPSLGLHSDESSSFLGQALTLNPYGDNVYAYENISKKIRAREVLFSVWREAISKEIQWTAGGLQYFLAEKVLQSGMQLDSFTQRICYFVWCIQTSHEAQGWGLHGMWIYENCRNSSRGQKPIEQFKRELGYAMCQLSYEIALEGRKDAVEAESILQGVREASERAWALSQALPEMEEVWRSSLDQKVWEKGCYIEATSIGNRTDELRLLGNGVVPATAERAFRVLMQELIDIPTQTH